MTSQERRGDGLKSQATCPFVHKLLKAINKNDIKGPHYLIFENDGFPSQNATNADGVPMLCSRNTCWRHQMETFSALLALCAKNSPVTDEFPSQGPVTRSFGVSLIRSWINGWVNNREAGDVRRHRAHYHVSVTNPVIWLQTPLHCVSYDHMDTNKVD